MRLSLDRMEIEDFGGTDPVKLAAAIHRQLGNGGGAVPVHDIARALDIVEIREQPLRNFEGALITKAERDIGSILVNSRSNAQRRRYSIAHELLHFLNPLHRSTGQSGFECNREDMAADRRTDRSSLSAHQRQEIEANRFAIELLAPVIRIKTFLRGAADLEHALGIAGQLDISKQAATRRYIELRQEPLAAVFSKNGTIIYPDWGPAFPMLAIRKHDRLPGYAMPSNTGDALSMMDEVDAADWLKAPRNTRLFSQTFDQADGHAITLLLAEPNGSDVADED